MCGQQIGFIAKDTCLHEARLIVIDAVNVANFLYVASSDLISEGCSTPGDILKDNTKF